MTLAEYGRVVKERWTWIAGSVLVVVLLSLTFILVRPPAFTATTELYVSAQTNTDSAQAAYQGSLLSEQRITSYVELAKSPRVMQEVIDRLKLPTDAESLAERVNASNRVDSVLLDVSATAETPEAAAQIADAVGEALPVVINDLERPSDPRLPAAIAVRQVAPALVPAERSGVGTTGIVGAALLAGLLLGVGVALLVNIVDTRVKDRDDLRRATELPVLSTIAVSNGMTTEALDLGQALRGPAADDYKSLRTNLTFSDVDHPARVVAITSSLPGEGKTTTACLLGAALAAGGARVLLVDADLRRPTMAKRLGAEPGVGVTTVLSGRIELNDAIQFSGSPNLDLLASGQNPANPSEILASQSMLKLLETAARAYDYIIVDTAPILPVPDTLALTTYVDGTVLLCRSQKTRKAEAKEARDRIQGVSGRVLGTVLSMSRGISRGSYKKYGYYSQAVSSDTAKGSLIPDDVALQPRLSQKKNGGAFTSDEAKTDMVPFSSSRPSPTPAPRSSPQNTRTRGT